MASVDPSERVKSTGRYILIGVITAAPLAITWLILDFLFGQLSRICRPWIRIMARALAPEHPLLAAWIEIETLLSIVTALVVLAFIWALRWAASRMIGQRLIVLFEALIGMIPFVDRIYQSTKRFLTVAGGPADGECGAVLIDFPSSEMKTIGLVTRVLKDKWTGEEVGVVYVPTSPNPTSGYIEIVPIKKLTFTDWTFDQAMSFVITDGPNAPDTIEYFRQVVRAGASPPAKT